MARTLAGAMGCLMRAPLIRNSTTELAVVKDVNG